MGQPPWSAMVLINLFFPQRLVQLLVFRNFGLFNFAGTFPELTENLGVSSAELTNRDSRSSLPDPTRWPDRKQ